MLNTSLSYISFLDFAGIKVRIIIAFNELLGECRSQIKENVFILYTLPVSL